MTLNKLADNYRLQIPMVMLHFQLIKLNQERVNYYYYDNI